MSEIINQQKRERHRRKLELGLCPLHPQADSTPVVPGRRFCRACLDKKKEYQQKYQTKPTSKSMSRTRRKAVRAMLDGVKSHYGCMNPECVCPKQLPPYALDFHHIDGKEFNLGASSHHSSRRKLVAEVNKCTILCAICHRMETWGDLDASGFPLCRLDENFTIVG